GDALQECVHQHLPDARAARPLGHVEAPSVLLVFGLQPALAVEASRTDESAAHERADNEGVGRIGADARIHRASRPSPGSLSAPMARAARRAWGVGMPPADLTRTCGGNACASI